MRPWTGAACAPPGRARSPGRNDPAATRSIVPGRCRRAGRRRRRRRRPRVAQADMQPGMIGQGGAAMRAAAGVAALPQDDRPGRRDDRGGHGAHEPVRGDEVAPVRVVREGVRPLAFLRRQRDVLGRERVQDGPWRNQDAAPGAWRLMLWDMSSAIPSRARADASCRRRLGRPCGGCGTADAWPPGESALPARRIRRRAPAARR